MSQVDVAAWHTMGPAPHMLAISARGEPQQRWWCFAGDASPTMVPPWFLHHLRKPTGLPPTSTSDLAKVVDCLAQLEKCDSLGLITAIIII